MTAGERFPSAQRFYDYAFGGAAEPAGRARFPVTFLYDGAESAALLKDWEIHRTDADPAGGAVHHTLTLTDPKTALECRCEVTTFAEFAAVEWVGYFKNTGTADTPIIADIYPLDVTFPLAPNIQCTLHHARGSQQSVEDFAPLETPLDPGGETELGCPSGRSSNEAFPFFNLDAGKSGVIGAIGWTGGWAATFRRDDAGIHLRAGMRKTHLRLHAGEEIRTPRILLLFWEGESTSGYNLLRRFILAYHTPRPNGQLLQPPICDSVWGERPVAQTLAKAHWLKENDLPVEYFWIDAGWHGDAPYDPADAYSANWVRQVGNWYPHKELYPRGLKEVGDALKAMGIGFIVWFEPERVYLGTRWAREHPEWLFGPIENTALFNLGIPEARRFLTDYISTFMQESGITGYRQDFNMEPGPFWEAADAPDRVGMSEIRHVVGLYAFWDELLRRHPGLIIDNCASGGRRIDLETISRSVPLWRSDVRSPSSNVVAVQNQNQGLGTWVPLSAGLCESLGAYAVRSALGPGVVLQWSEMVLERGAAFDAREQRDLLLEALSVRKYFYGDFYPHTPFSVAHNIWVVWQYDRPDLGEGIVLAFRRPASRDDSQTVYLKGLDPAGQYELRTSGSDTVVRMVGQELTERGLTITIDYPGLSALLRYRRQA